MTEHVQTSMASKTGLITLDRPAALNSLSLEMVRTMTQALMRWRDDPAVSAVLVRGSSERAYCAGGDIRFFHQKGSANHTGGAALVEDFFNEEYALNHLVHRYPKPYVALMDGVVMGGGMGIAQAGPQARVRVVAERTKMAMPEVGIGLFPDVGGSWFLSRAPGQIGVYLAVTGDVISAAEAIYAGLADVFMPGAELPALQSTLIAASGEGRDLHAVARECAQQFAAQADPAMSRLAQAREAIDRHFAHASVQAIMDALADDHSEFASKALAMMQKRSPLMMSVALEQVRRGRTMGIADCLRMERTLVRRCFEHGEVLEGVRALVIDKDHAPRWNPPTLSEVTREMVEHFFVSAWPDHAHPLRELSDAP